MPISLSEDELDVLSWSSYGAILDFPEWFWLLSLFIYMLVAVGLFFYVRVARSVFAGVIIVFLLMTPFLGLNVFLGIEQMLLEMINIFDGAILAIAYFTSVSDRFESINS